MILSILSGKNLFLRAPEPGDIDFLYGMENDTSVWKVSNTFAPFSRFQLEQYIMNVQQDIYITKQLRLMIDLKQTSQPATSIGSIDLFDFDPYHFRAGIGILLTKSYRNRGYASEALGVLIRYAFETLHLHQLYCHITPDNLSSIKLFKKAGFVRCGIKKDWINEGDHWNDEWMFQLIRSHD
jgi:diamine N-acetyltransferase